MFKYAIAAIAFIIAVAAGEANAQTEYPFSEYQYSDEWTFTAYRRSMNEFGAYMAQTIYADMFFGGDHDFTKSRDLQMALSKQAFIILVEMGQGIQYYGEVLIEVYNIKTYEGTGQ